MTNLNNVNINQSTNQPKKYSNFVENTKRAIRNALVKTWIGVSSMMPMATPSIPTAVPASVNTITAMAPIASTVAKTITLWAAAELLTACGGGEDGPDTPINPVEKDTTAPTIDVSVSQVDITWWKQIRIDWNKLYIWDDLIASRSDDKSTNCNVTLWLNWKSITSGSSIDDDWTLTISVKDAAWNIKNAEIKLDKYKTMEITNIRPSDILPIVWQVEIWDHEAYNHIEHLRLAEATRIRDMMWEYGAGNHSKGEYQKLMNRLNTGMTMENPEWYDNFEKLWWEFSGEPWEHAHDERNIINTLINHSNFQISNPKNWTWNEHIQKAVKENLDNIYIFWRSAGWEFEPNEYTWRTANNIKELLKSKNFILFWAWTNILKREWTLKNKIYQEDIYTDDEHWIYALVSMANWKNDNNIDKHVLVTIATNKDWDVDQTNEIYGKSKFPVWFHDKILFAWRAFPYISWYNNWKIEAEWWKYATSYTNYVNVAMMDICFQMFAEAKDVDELLEMVRSTALTDYIRFDGFDPQPLQLINPAWFFQKYLMPNELPSNIKSWENIDLKKWYYKWVIFDIPGAEVKINWEWVEYSEKNKSLIKSQNPMNLQWRMNWDLCKKLYWEWKTIQWKIIVVDDKWNGLNIDKNFPISIK